MRCPSCDRDISPSASECPYCHKGITSEIIIQRLQRKISEARDLSTRSLQILETIEGQLAGLAGTTGPVPQTAVEGKIESPASLMTDAEPLLTSVAPPSSKTFFAQSERTKPKARNGAGEANFGQKWLLFSGVIITLFGVGYFLKYAFEQEWIGPIARVALAYLAGLAFMGCGEFARRKKFDAYGLNLVAGGIGLLYLASFACFQLYHLIDQLPALGLMVLVTVFSCLLALHYDRRSLAVLGVVGGFLSPVLVSTGHANVVGLLGYMTILNAGILTLALFKRWGALNVVGFLFTWGLYSAFVVIHYRAEMFWPLIIFANLFFLFYSLAPFLYYFVTPANADVKGLYITVPNAFIGLGYSCFLIKESYSLGYAGIVSVLYAALFLALASHLYKKNPLNLVPALQILQIAIVFLAITVPILCEQHWITVFWAIQAVTLMYCGLRLQSKNLVRFALLLLGITTYKLTFIDWPELFDYRSDYHWYVFVEPYRHLLAERWLTSSITIGALSCSAALSRRAGGRAQGPLWAMASACAFLFLNFETGAFLHRFAPDAVFAGISILWAIISISLVIHGFIRNGSFTRKCGLTLFAFTVLKVFLVDMEHVSTPYRVLSFILLGLLLIAGSFLYYKYRDRVGEKPQ